MDITARQRKIMAFIQDEIRAKGYPPSVREIGDAVGLNSSSTVHNHLQKLEAAGFIRRDPTKPRAIEVLVGDPYQPRKEMVNVPIVGRVTAGTPILAVENIEDTFPLPQDFVRDQEVFMLRVHGDSMVGVGIYDGDYAVVRQQSVANNGDIVVALIGDEATIKRFYLESNHVRLQPENPLLEPIISRDVKILGKVVGLLRRMD